MLSIETLISGAQTLYTLVQDYKDNQKQLKILAEDIKATTDAVQVKQDQFFDSETKRVKRGKDNQPATEALKLLKSCIEDAQAIVESFKDQPGKGNAKRFIKFFSELGQASGYKEEINTIYQNLNSAKNTLNLVVVLHQEQCQAALQADVSQIHSLLEDLEKQVRTGSTQLEAKMDVSIEEISTLSSKFDQLRKELAAEFAKKSSTGPKVTVEVTDEINDSDIQGLIVTGDEAITLQGVHQYGDPRTLAAFQQLKDKEAEQRKMLSSGVDVSVTSKTMSKTKVYGTSFNMSPPHSSSSTHTTTTSPLTGPSSSSTFASSHSGSSSTSSSSSHSSSSSSSTGNQQRAHRK